MKKLTILILALWFISVATAFPLLPSQYYGTLIIDSYYAPPGTKVSVGLSDTEICGSAIINKIGYYSVSCNGDNPSTSIIEGPKQNSQVRFFVNDTDINITKIWKEAAFTRVDIAHKTTVKEAKESKSPVAIEDEIVLLWLFLGLIVIVIVRLRKINEK